MCDYHAVMGVPSCPIILCTHLCLVDEDIMRHFAKHFSGQGG